MNRLRITFALFLALLLAAPTFANVVITDDGDKTEKSRDREQRAREKMSEADDDLYDRGTDLLDQHQWRRAASIFDSIVHKQGPRMDSALYWLAYARNKMGQRSEALSALLALQQGFPKSRWTADGKALEVEIRQAAGQNVEPHDVADEDVKLMALNGLMSSDPERAIPVLESILTSPKSSDRVKDRALFVLSQAHSTRAVEILGRIARDTSSPKLQERALRYIGIMGGETSRKLLADVYASTTVVEIKKSVMRSLMISGDNARLLALARTETIPELRADAVQQLGVMGARNELAELYNSEPSVDVRKKIIQGMFIGGNAEKLGDIARTEKVVELRVVAIRNLGLLGGARSGELLRTLYESNTDTELRRAVINSLFLQQNAKALVDLARKEKDIELKREIISKLSLIHSPDATDYLLEYLRE